MMKNVTNLVEIIVSIFSPMLHPKCLNIPNRNTKQKNELTENLNLNSDSSEIRNLKLIILMLNSPKS